jgi:hypothetical protein
MDWEVETNTESEMHFRWEKQFSRRMHMHTRDTRDSPHEGKITTGTLAIGFAPINVSSGEISPGHSSFWARAFGGQYSPSWKPLVRRGSCGVLSSGWCLISPVLQKIVRDGRGGAGWMLDLPLVTTLV